MNKVTFTNTTQHGTKFVMNYYTSGLVTVKETPDIYEKKKTL